MFFWYRKLRIKDCGFFFSIKHVQETGGDSYHSRKKAQNLSFKILEYFFENNKIKQSFKEFKNAVVTLICSFYLTRFDLKGVTGNVWWLN